MTVNVAFCGAPLVGKSTLLAKIAKAGSSKDYRHFRLKTDVVVSASIKPGPTRIFLKTAAGAVFYQEEVLRYLLADAHLVVYVLSAAPAPDRDAKAFSAVTGIANELAKGWESVPWLLVLNKIDLGDGESILECFPPRLHEKVLRTAARSASGVKELFETIIATGERLNTQAH